MDVLVQLSTDEDSDVRVYVAQNPNTPVDVLVQLSSDKDSDVRQAAVAVRRNVAQNPNTQWMY
ncbi:MAG: HEAT repeat domain-containing protein [Cyanobacteria bacterium LVE1205-1]